MKPVQKFVVTANLPEKISKLKELAYNYWWCWNSDAKELFNRIDRKLWSEVHHNPILLINKVNIEHLNKLAEQDDFVSFLNYVYNDFQKYMDNNSWYNSQLSIEPGTIAYFSPEYGINESFPNYSGGLGILSGDHLKSASDLGIPLLGIGLLYQMGYFRQHLTQNGWQNEIYNYNDFFTLPIVLIRDGAGLPLLIDVDLPNGKAFAQIWRLNVGKVPLFLLDTNIPQNQSQEYKDITDGLYGGTRDTRIQQEILLGIGGMRALKAMGIEPDVVHINEGHAAFALIERTRMLMEKYNLDFRAAKQITKASSLFTTHTPVPAGNEVFSLGRIEHYFHNYWPSIGFEKEDFFSLGQEQGHNNEEKFSMTVLGLRLSSHHNGVSELHGVVSRNMWQNVWKDFPIDEVPIEHVTNGIHTQTWVAREFSALFDRYLSPSWRTDTDNKEIWEKVDFIPSEELYREKQRRRVRLILFARDYLKKKQKNFLPPDQIGKINEYLDSNALTIGFARRFATYKRALLLFKDMDRLKNILTSQEKPVQVIIAGKAHPLDTMGKEVIQNIIKKVREHNLEKHIVFLEDYDMVIARLMVKGCDVWLNTPLRPYEASGTSGMKAGLNGTLNFSIPDGWWDEGFTGDNGFLIGEGETYSSSEEQDIVESEALYTMLENTIVPLFYDRSKTNVPRDWVHYMKNSMKTIGPEYSTSRMLKDYALKYYINANQRYRKLIADNASGASDIRIWKDRIKANWKKLEIIDISGNQSSEASIDKAIEVSTIIDLGELKPEDVSVQVYYGSINHNGDIINSKSTELELEKSANEYHYFKGHYYCTDTGQQGFTVRILPKHELIVSHAELYLCHWANNK